jgi:hypothetical protein
MRNRWRERVNKNLMWSNVVHDITDPGIDGGDYGIKMSIAIPTIWWDLDGVLREIDKVGPNADYNKMEQHDYYYKQWDEVKKWLDDIPDRLLELPPTEYCNTVFRYYNRRAQKMRIITCQPNNWRHFAIKWIHQRTDKAMIYFTDTPKGKIEVMKDNTANWVLIEDYPYFDSYDNIILIDRPYNQNVKCDIRVHSPQELIAIVEDIEHGYNPWEKSKERREREESLAEYCRALQTC